MLARFLRSRRGALGLLAALSLVLAATASAQETTAAYPTRPVRLLVGFPAGSALDLMARPLAQKLSEQLGQPVTVDNRPGANGALATEAVAHAAADGYAVLLGTPGQTIIYPLLRRDLPFDVGRDLRPVASVMQPIGVVAVPAELPVRSFAELVALAQARPGQLAMGSAGSGDPAHLAFELLKRQMGLDILHVPYRGSGLALQDMLGGRIQMMIAPYIVLKASAEAGRVRVLAVTTAGRAPVLPEVPTVAEASGPSNFEFASAIGLYVAAATPRGVVARLEAATAQAVQEADLARTYAEQGVVPAFSGGDQFAAWLVREREKWSRIIREANISLD